MSSKTAWVVLFALLAIPVLGGAPAFAQTQATTGVIEGTVSDPSGAVVSGASVTLTNTGTGFERQVATNESGFYRGVLLPLGAYKVTVEKQGFATMVIKDIEVTLGASIPVNAQLKVKTGSEQIVVTGEEPLVNSSQTETSAGLDKQQLHAVPVSNRNYLDLVTLTPNVSISNGTDGPEINVNGQKGTQTSFNVDGANANNVFFGEQRGGQRPVANVSMEAVREFQVVAEGAPAEFGGYSGAFINVVTKSGTNDFHGSLFHLQELHGLTGALADGSSLKGYHRENYGGSAGGPIKKDKLFFFGTYEGVNTRFSKASNLVHCCTLFTPVTPLLSIASLASPANGGVPVDLGAIFANTPTIASKEAGPIKHTNDLQSFLVKADWIPNAKHNVTLRHYFARSIQDNGTFDIPTFGRTDNGQERSKSNTFVAQWTWALSSKYLNEFRFEYGREFRPRNQVLPPDLPDTSIGTCSQPAGFSPAVAGCFSGSQGNGANYRFGRPFFHPSTVTDEQFQVSDNFSIVTGSHAIKFGGTTDNIRVQNFFEGFARGRYTFDSVEGFVNYLNLGPGFVECSDGSSGTGPAVGNPTCLGAAPTSGIVGPLLLYLQFTPVPPATVAQSANNNFNQFESGLFIQDKWQARSGLTISYGLRWDNYNQRAPFAPITQIPRLAQFLSSTNPPFPSDGTVPSYHKAFQPRLGIAWDPWHNGKTVIRANGGIFFARLPALMVANGTANNGALGTTIFADSAFNSFGATPPLYPNCALGVFVEPNCPLATSASQLFDPAVVLFAKHFVYPRSTQASIWVERQLAKDWAVSTGFNYAISTHLNRVVGFNVPPANGTGPDGRTQYTGNFGLGPFSGPFFSGTGIATFSSLIQSRSRSLYRSFAVKVDKKYSRNILFSAQYTYARDVDDDSNERDQFTAKFSDPKNFGPERGPSDRDRRHRFSAFGLWNLPWGFSWSNTFTASSATPRSLLCNFDANGDSFPDNDRVFTDGKGNYSCGAGGVGNIVDLGNGKTATLVGSLTGGHDVGRNTFRKNDQFFDWSMRIQKDWSFRDRYHLLPSAEIYNIAGQKNLRLPVCGELRGCFDGTFLQVPGDPRRARLGLRLEW